MTAPRIAAFLLLVAVFVGCDHAAKQIAQNALASSGPVSFAADTVRFELAFNRGGFLSLGAALPAGLRDAVFLVAVPALLVCVCAYALRAGLAHGWPLLGLALIAGGGVSNWLDRLLNGAVTDYLVLGVGPLHTGVLNLADVLIFAGVALLLFSGTNPVESDEQQAETP